MDRQAVLRRVYEHLFKQNMQAIGTDGLCRYRTKNGLMCAIGCLLSKDASVRYIEGFNADQACVIRKIDKRYGPVLDPVPDVDIEFLLRLQRVHDMHCPEEWPKELMKLAFDYKLKVPLVSKAVAKSFAHTRHHSFLCGHVLSKSMLHEVVAHIYMKTLIEESKHRITGPVSGVRYEISYEPSGVGYVDVSRGKKKKIVFSGSIDSALAKIARIEYKVAMKRDLKKKPVQSIAGA